MNKPTKHTERQFRIVYARGTLNGVVWIKADDLQKALAEFRKCNDGCEPLMAKEETEGSFFYEVGGK